MFPDHLIIDFDSTFITKESLDELARFSLADHPEKKGRLEKIKSLTEAGMVGEITFDESLLTIPISEFSDKKLEISTNDFSPELSTLSFTP